MCARLAPSRRFDAVVFRTDLEQGEALHHPCYLGRPITTALSAVRLHEHSFTPFISEAEVGVAIDRVAADLREEYRGKRPLFVGVLNGAYFFASELVKRLDIECEITFVKVASYHGTTSGGDVTQLIGLNQAVSGRHVVVLEDIVETGNTVAHILAALEDHHPATVRVAAMLFKPDALRREVTVHHAALRIPNDFVVGSGLDHDGLGRNLPGIWRIMKD
jgi:hypoxanthine phosphoribosyltransferase